ncbi:Eco57I restriction-modification methylase domain-containing protein [Actinomadura macra]|uniref:Eco57I restriction-modification methylase domain-containing protein n=1 Tax=Actinomadura macra TaxID=46164 RepID=UPI000B27C1CF|nr:Eco57I restriction-modification methylase domain-containing protein [Actinomadura macra]
MVTQALFDVDEPSLPMALQAAVRHGEIFTRRWVVELILDLVGYTANRDLAELSLVEPACGQGAFVGPVVERLSKSCRDHGRPLSDAAESIRTFDLLHGNVELTRTLVRDQLTADGWGHSETEAIVSGWVRQGDYLLAAHRTAEADFVVGNPPYIRLEDVPEERMMAYRAVCPTMGGRADVYVGFYETALRSLKTGGKLGFICADRWMRNQYGRRLRQTVTRRHSMDLVLTMHDVDAFHEPVSAYPAITIIRNAAQGAAIAADTTRGFGPSEAQELLGWLNGPSQDTVVTASFKASRLPHWFPGEDSWPAASPARLAVLEELSDRFQLLEDETTGTRVGIGVATGADKVFITERSDLVEEDRMLPLAMVRDTTSGNLDWGGMYLVNPWNELGGLVDLAAYPRLRAYLTRHRAALQKRHVARKQPERWYKTIDKVDPQLNTRPKLLLPDMKQVIHPVLDEGGLYPHHNLYFIVSDVWDLRVLGGLLLSNVAEAFVEAYAVKMRGGTLRFQAQYLRKIRVPDPAEIDEVTGAALAAAFERRDVQAATQAALRAYGLPGLPD